MEEMKIENFEKSKMCEMLTTIKCEGGGDCIFLF